MNRRQAIRLMGATILAALTGQKARPKGEIARLTEENASLRAELEETQRHADVWFELYTGASVAEDHWLTRWSEADAALTKALAEADYWQEQYKQAIAERPLSVTWPVVDCGITTQDAEGNKTVYLLCRPRVGIDPKTLDSLSSDPCPMELRVTYSECSDLPEPPEHEHA